MSETVCGNSLSGRVIKSDDPKLLLFHNSRENPIKVICTKDNPASYGLGRNLKKGDIVTIKGTTYYDSIGFCVSVPSECGIYDYKCFEEYSEAALKKARDGE